MPRMNPSPASARRRGEGALPKRPFLRTARRPGERDLIRLGGRSRQQEQMDEPGLDPAVYDRVLRDLARVNGWTLAARPTLGFLRRASRGMVAFRLLDVGFGHGDMLRRIARWARRRGIAVDLVGVDLNPNSEAAARAATPPATPID